VTVARYHNPRRPRGDLHSGLSTEPSTGCFASAQPPRTIAFHGARGGAGATMLAAEMVRELAAEGRSVAAIDADIDRGALHYRLDMPVGRTTFSIADVVNVMDEITAERLQSALARCACGACLLPQPAGRERPQFEQAEAIGLIDTVAPAFDNTVVDTAACADPFTAGLLRASDLVVLVVTPELACLGGARRALATLDSLPGGRPRIEMVINRSLGARDIVTRGDVETFLEMRAAAVLPEDTVRCRRLADECKPLSSERSPLAQAVLEFIRALSG
jgi:Flp pilus assembly CpaE family ATPase